MSDVEPEREEAGADMLDGLLEQIKRETVAIYDREAKTLTLSSVHSPRPKTGSDDNLHVICHPDGVKPKPWLAGALAKAMPEIDRLLERAAKLATETYDPKVK